MLNIDEFSQHPEHSSSTISKLARESFELGHFEEAERLYSILAQTLARMLGAKHVETAMAKYNLAQCLALQGKMQECHTLTDEISDIFTDTHPMKSKDFFEPDFHRKAG